LVLVITAAGVLGWRATHPRRAPAITLPPLPQASIAVLPFVNMSARPEEDYFSDGMTEELITTLSRLPGLRVAARTSSWMFKGRATDVREIGRELGVATVLEGSIRRTDTRLRISAQLIDARNGYQMWTQEFDRGEGDVFAIQDDIAEAIVSALATQFNVHPLPLPPRMTPSPETYELYLRARYAWRQRTTPALLEAVRLFREVIRRDPRYAPAYAGLGACYVVLPLYSTHVTSLEMYARADDAATHAMQLDSTLSEPYAILGLVRARRYDWRGAEEAYRTAIARNPNDATAHQWYGKALTQQGRVVDGEREVRRALALDPFSAVIRYNLGQTLLVARRYDDAAAALEGALAQAPDFVAARTVLGLVRDAQGRPRDALRELQAVVHSESRRNADNLALLAYAYARAGIRDTAQQLLAEALRARARLPRVSATDIAVAYLGLGEHDRAFTWLERARVEHDSDLEAFVPSPLLGPLRGDPRFVRLETEMHLR
ncbi:MAG: tetratricopeptide repeat protein, partial [Gemmatimonadaceae bacterium]|nr:tetratricopeptide repeat protein [Gemmatimonadaceae bacterium]